MVLEEQAANIVPVQDLCPEPGIAAGLVDHVQRLLIIDLPTAIGQRNASRIAVVQIKPAKGVGVEYLALKACPVEKPGQVVGEKGRGSA